MTEPRIASFEEFWPYYVGAHRHPMCRALHYAGTSAGMVSAICGLFTLNFWLILLAPVLGYGAAWIGHFGIEKNKPATFGYFKWSFMGDYKMLWLGLQGRMDSEVARLYGTNAPAPDAPLLARA